PIFELRLNTRAQDLTASQDGYAVALAGGGNAELAPPTSAPYIFNCTYAGLNTVRGDFTGADTPLKHELTEMALVDVPEPLRGLGITVMDGPFFSLMPFPSRGLHTLSHVRYTPHCSWQDDQRNPYDVLAAHGRESRADRML